MKALISKSSELVDLLHNDRNVRISVYCFLFIILLSTLLLTFKLEGKTYTYTLGDISTEEVRVPREIRYVNEEETKIKQETAVMSAPLVFDRDPTVLMEKLRIISLLYNNVSSTVQEAALLPAGDLKEQLASLKIKIPRYLHYNDDILLELLTYHNTEYMKKAVVKILIYIYENNQVGILDKEYSNPLNIQNKNIAIRTVVEGSKETEIARTLDDLQTVESIKKKLYKICYAIAPNLPKKTRWAVVQVVRSNLKSNLQFNVEETNRRINEKIKAVKPIMGVLKKGQTIVRGGDTVTSDILKKLDIISKNAATTNISYTIGIFLVQLLFFLIFSLFLMDYRHILLPDSKSSWVLLTLISAFIIYGFLFSKTGIALEKDLSFVLFMPIPLITMTLVILYNIYLSLIIGVFLLAQTAFFQGQLDLTLFILGFSSIILGTFVNRMVERRSDFMRGGLVIGLCNALLVIAITLMDEAPISFAISNVQLALAGGIINTTIALGLFPMYENLLGLTTKFKLLELSDLNADIFKNMLVNAPGTYNHSLLVSTMAESSCKAIGANHLLARVGAFYHDIGKIEDAGIYIENRITDPRATKLNPQEYAQLIISHNEKGVKLAKEHDLPESIIRFIQEHHGNSVMTFFYHQALEYSTATGSTEHVDREMFQYPGPKPSSKETAIVMIADAVEAASRSLQDPDEDRLEGLVKKIIFNKLNDGEMDYSDLTMADLDKVKDAMLQILHGVFHTRIKYPDAEDLRRLEDKVQEQNGKS